MNNIQGQAARKAHKVQHCWPPCKKNSKLKKTNKHIHIHIHTYIVHLYTRKSASFKLSTLKCKDVPFWGSRWWIITVRGPKSPNTPIFGILNRHFKPNMRKIRTAISSDLCIRWLTWHLTGSCGQQQGLRELSRMVVKHSKTADGRHFENRYIAISQWKIIWFLWRDQKMKKLHWTDSEFDRTYFLL